MTDFLSRLVDRALGETKVAQPLIAPFFAQGAEILSPDATPFVATQTENHMPVDEPSFDSISHDSPVTTASLPIEKTRRSEMNQEEAETYEEPTTRVLRTEGRQYGDETASDSVSYDPTIVRPSTPVEVTRRAEMKHEKAETHSTERKESSRISEDVAQRDETGPLSSRERQRAKAESEPASYSREDERLATSPSHGSTAENPPAALTGREADTHSPGTVSPMPEILRSTEPKTRKSLRTNERDLSADSESLQEVRAPAHLSESERAAVESSGHSIELEVRNVGDQRSVTPHPDRDARQTERSSFVLPYGARNAKQTTSGQHRDNQQAKSASGQEQSARQSDSVSEESITHVSAIPVESDSHAGIILRPERITARGRAGSPSRATGEESTPSMQAAPTIKVTIGRIEVRAIMPPAPREKKTAPPAPRMSLDDYLKSHSGGRR